MKNVLPFERLEVYAAALEFLGLSDRIAASLPASQEYLAAQLWELAVAIPVQIARAAGQPNASEAAAVFVVARATAARSAAILDVIEVIGLGDAGQIARSGALLERIVSGLDLLTRHGPPVEVLEFEYADSAG